MSNEETGSGQENPDQNASPAPAQAVGGEKPVVVIQDRSIDPHVVMYHEPMSIQAEQYRAFRTNLLAMGKGQGSRSLAITSARKGEGKSLSAVNIAICLAEAPNTRVCLIDSDFRAPTVAKLMGLGDGKGLSELLMGEANLSGRILRETKIRHLSVIRAGRLPRNPAELLASDRVTNLIETLKQDYTHILCDTPPVNPYTDGAVLGAQMDGVILVVRIGVTNREQGERAKHVIRGAGGNILGTFLTDVPADRNIENEYYRALED